jgi:hypothetical protein
MQRPWLLAAVLAILGMAAMVLPFVLDSAPWLNDIHPVWGALLLVVAVLFLILPPSRPEQYPLRMTVLSVVAVVLAEVGVLRVGAPAYDLREASRLIAAAMAAGHPVATLGRYHGQFGFYGRLTRPIRQLAAGQTQDWARAHPDGYLVFTGHGRSAPPGDDVLFAQPYQSGYLAIRDGHGVVKAPGPLP